MLLHKYGKDYVHACSVNVAHLWHFVDSCRSSLRTTGANLKLTSFGPIQVVARHHSQCHRNATACAAPHGCMPLCPQSLRLCLDRCTTFETVAIEQGLSLLSPYTTFSTNSNKRENHTESPPAQEKPIGKQPKLRRWCILC
jgi:hypothetical protein